MKNKKIKIGSLATLGILTIPIIATASCGGSDTNKEPKADTIIVDDAYLSKHKEEVTKYLEDLTEEQQNGGNIESLVKKGVYKEHDFSKLKTIPENFFKELIENNNNNYGSFWDTPEKSFPDNIDFSGVEKIGEHGFESMVIWPKNMKFPNLKEIPKGAFKYLHALPNKMVFPKVKTLGASTFVDIKTIPIECKFPNLTTIEDDYSEEDFNTRFNELISLPKGYNFPKLKYIGRNAFSSLKAFPEGFNLNNAEKIGDYAFYNVSSFPENFSLPEVLTIGEAAFSHSPIKLSEFPENFTMPKVIEIGGDAFAGMPFWPKNLTLPSIRRIGKDAFWNVGKQYNDDANKEVKDEKAKFEKGEGHDRVVLFPKWDVVNKWNFGIKELKEIFSIDEDESFPRIE